MEHFHIPFQESCIMLGLIPRCAPPTTHSRMVGIYRMTTEKSNAKKTINQQIF